jgi:hypothetical protein
VFRASPFLQEDFCEGPKFRFVGEVVVWEHGSSCRTPQMVQIPAVEIIVIGTPHDRQQA